MNFIKAINVLGQIFNHFGEDRQRLQLIEEVNELKEALDKGDEDEILDEMADVLNLLLQHVSHSKNKTALRSRLNFKIERTVHRIKEGYYK